MSDIRVSNIELEFEVTKDFTKVSNKLIEDPTLSALAKWIVIYASGRPRGWVLWATALAEYVKDGIEAIRSALDELKERGILVIRQKFTTQGKFDGKQWVFTLKGLKSREAKRSSRTTASRTTGITSDGDPAANKTISPQSSESLDSSFSDSQREGAFANGEEQPKDQWPEVNTEGQSDSDNAKSLNSQSPESEPEENTSKKPVNLTSDSRPESPPTIEPRESDNANNTPSAADPGPEYWREQIEAQKAALMTQEAEAKAKSVPSSPTAPAVDVQAMQADLDQIRRSKRACAQFAVKGNGWMYTCEADALRAFKLEMDIRIQSSIAGMSDEERQQKNERAEADKRRDADQILRTQMIAQEAQAKIYAEFEGMGALDLLATLENRCVKNSDFEKGKWNRKWFGVWLEKNFHNQRLVRDVIDSFLACEGRAETLVYVKNHLKRKGIVVDLKKREDKAAA